MKIQGTALCVVGLLLGTAMDGCSADRGGSAPAEVLHVAEAQAFWKALGPIGFRGVALVAQDGKPVLFEGAGGVSETATFDLASIAKAITAIATLRLADRGKLKMVDPLSRFFPDTPQDKRAITVHQLLTHTGGIGNPTGDTAYGVHDRAEAVRMILATPLEGPPGSAYRYSNDGYTLVAAILEVVTSKTWEQVIRDEVLAPAGMEHTFFVGDPWPKGPFAVAVAKVHDGEFPNSGNWGQKGGAGILSTAPDLLRLIDAAVDGRLLGPSGLSELGTSYASRDQSVQYSRAFDLRNPPGRGLEWNHGGADTRDGHYSSLQYYPARRALLVVMGLDDERLVGQVTSALAKEVFGEKLGAGEMPPPNGGRPATDWKEGFALVGEGLRFTVEPGPSGTTLLPQNPESTAFIVARSAEDEAAEGRCVRDTRKLLDDVAREAAAGTPQPNSVLGHTVSFWKEATSQGGPARNVAVLGAVPNWVDDLGGMLSFVEVTFGTRTRVFRLYWADGTFKARGGSVYPNPAPSQLIAFGDNQYGAWNPAIGTYAALRLVRGTDGTEKAILQAGKRTVTLAIVRGSANPS
jgi:CubicO group peptidase (beta-lactamase class C family)